MRAFEELLRQSSSVHGHQCAGQVLGVRMAMAGCLAVDIDEPKGCKKLLVYVEMDRCATDAIQAVTGCSLGKRTLKFLDYGKMAATFVNTQTQQAVRVLAKDDTRLLAPLYAPDAASPREAQKEAYAVMADETLFALQPVTVKVPEADMPGFRGRRVHCHGCGEGINLRREVYRNGRALCVPCAQGGLPAGGIAVNPLNSASKVVLIVGYKKVGKTKLIEKLIAELASRGYRVGSVKHHHSDYPAEVDCAGTDTWRHRRAGANVVALVTPRNVAVFRESAEAASLDRVLSTFSDQDIVLVEGFHLQPRAKIEVRSARGDRLCPANNDLLAVVGPTAPDEAVPGFAPDHIEPLVDLIENKILGKVSTPASHH